LSDLERLATDEESEESQAYSTRKSLFDQTKKVYSRDSPFLDAVAKQLFTPAHQDIIRKANRATFVSSILQSHDVSFFDLNEYFLEIFVPPGQRLLKWQGGIFLELKTQVYISALLNSDGGVVTLLDELFPPDLDERIMTRHPDTPSLAPSEQDFVERAKARKQYLQAEPADIAAMTLPTRYDWQDFLKEFLGCISKNVDSLLNSNVRHVLRYGRTEEADIAQNRSQASLAASQSQPDNTGRKGTPAKGSILAEAKTAKNRSRRLSSGGAGVDISATDSSMQELGALMSDESSRRMANATSTTLARGNDNDESSSPTPVDTKTTKPSTSALNNTPRQTWKAAEEEALLAGLEAVKGPHWSQILSLYGRGGSVSEELKDRNQIQLKDKARNLKLCYLKTGRQVPEFLQGVTGELRKRGGARVRAALGLDGPEGVEMGLAGEDAVVKVKAKKGGGKRKRKGSNGDAMAAS